MGSNGVRKCFLLSALNVVWVVAFSCCCVVAVLRVLRVRFLGQAGSLYLYQ